EKFFERYLETLDPQHLHFTQEDLAEFDHYRLRLDNLTLTRNGVADTSPAYEIFNRFFGRLSQRVAYADELLKNEKFDFTTDERMLANRHESSYPKDLAEAKQLWRQRLRFEYLQEKLAGLGAKKKPEVLAGKTMEFPLTNATALSNSATSLPDETISPKIGQGGQKIVIAAHDTTPASKPTAPPPETKKKTDAEEIVDLLSRRYHRNLHMFKEWDNEDVLEKYLTALAHVYDPHSDYMNDSGAKNFAIGMNLALFGIGAVLTTDLDGYCKIQELKPGPAMKSKQIKVGDRIAAVAQGNAAPVDVVEMNLNKAVQLIRGPKGSEVRLTIIPVDSPSDRRVVSLFRDEIKLEDQEVKAKIIEMPAATVRAHGGLASAGRTLRLGVIDLPTFYATIDRAVELAGNESGAGATRPTPRSTSADVGKMLKKFKEENVVGVILDLRRNGGGSLEEAIKLTGLFIKEGPVVQVRSSDGRKFVREDADPGVLYDGPLIVLTSRFSASASEIVAGALQDYGRALVVGDISTHGKGTVQNLNQLRPYVEPATATATNDPGELKLTIQKFYRASGASTQLKGVMPDIVLPSVLNHSKDIGEGALENPLQWDTIPSANFDKLNLVEPCLGELLKHSNQRVTTDQDFAYIREDIGLFRKHQEDKTISLNEQQRLKEKDEAEARQKARDKERLARKDPDRKIYELALKQTDLPGLPPPVAKTNALAKSLAANVGASGASTHSASAASQLPSPGGSLDEEDEEEEKPPAVDVTLEEAEHILVDYISLLSQKSLLTVNR
ncbi:MAG: carboxy terminal-processing peptidase, partial [Verrucomicrobia bacterium]|nr:carboxy terminal-processing peptidase [Verrucomicrobiota bacterium]